MDVARWETEEEFVDAQETDPDGGKAKLPSELGEGGVYHEVLAPPEESGDDEVADEDGNGHYGVEGEGEDAPALAEGHFAGLVKVSLLSLDFFPPKGLIKRTCFPGRPQLSSCAVSRVPTAHRVRCLRSDSAIVQQMTVFFFKDYITYG